MPDLAHIVRPELPYDYGDANDELGSIPYRDAWALQEQVHAEVLAGGEERILLVEHPPVITFGRRAETMGQKNLISSSEAPYRWASRSFNPTGAGT